jgi:hypothetical protein
MSTLTLPLKVWRCLVAGACLWTLAGAAQAATQVLNDGTATAGLTRVQNHFGNGGQSIALFAESAAGGLVAEQTDGFTDFPLHAAWYVPSIRVVNPACAVRAEARPAVEYPETRVGVMGWLDPDRGRGIALRARPNPADNRFEVSVVDFAAATEFENDSLTGLFNLDGSPADALPGSAQAEGGAYTPDAFATFELEFALPSPGHLAVLPDATAVVRARVFQLDGSSQLVQVGGTIELLTNFPVPARHRVAYYANWNSNLIPGSTVGTVRMLTITGDIEQVNQSPAVALTSPAAGATSPEPGSFQLAATASDPDGTVLRVDFLQNGQVVGTVTTSPYQFTLSGLPAGDYRLAARATDNLGATATTDPVTVAVLPNQPPTVAITSPTAGAEFFAPAEFDIVAQASDLDGTVARVEFFDGATLLGAVTQAPFVFRVTDLPAGQHSLIARATDNRGAATSSAPVNVLVRANLPPTVTISRPADGARFGAPAAFTLTATAADADGQVASVEFRRDGASIATVTAPPYETAVTGLPAGRYVFTATATDNRGAASAPASVTIEVVSADVPPRFVSYRPLPSAENFQQLQVTIVGKVGATYVVERTADYRTWTPVETVTLQTATLTRTYPRDAVARLTVLRLREGSVPAQPPVLSTPQALPSSENFQQFRFTASGLNGRTYRVESSTDLRNWTLVETRTATADTVTLTYPRSTVSAFLFYRVAILP